jgi:ankyrin repeat protein
MSKCKSKKQELTFYHFVHASVCDEPLARKMIRDNPSWLTEANGIGETALTYVVIENHLVAARFLLNAGADVNTRDHSAETPLMHASGLNYQEMVALLLEHGADVNAADQFQETALFKAVQRGSVEICEMLVSAGANMQVVNFIDQCLSDVILPRKYEQVLSMLIRHGYQEPLPPEA